MAKYCTSHVQVQHIGCENYGRSWYRKISEYFWVNWILTAECTDKTIPWHVFNFWVEPLFNSTMTLSKWMECFTLKKVIFSKFNILLYIDMCRNTHKEVQLAQKGQKVLHNPPWESSSIQNWKLCNPFYIGLYSESQ